MKISIIQADPKTADFAQNFLTLKNAALAADKNGAELIIAPEYALSGPNPKDMLKNESFFDKTKKAIKQLAEVNTKSTLIFGAFIKEGKDIYNAAVIISGRRIEYIKKSMLSYEEAFYLTKAKQSSFCLINGKKVLITLGDEIFLDYLFADKPDFVINLSAKPYLRGAISRDLQALSNIAKEQGTMLISANLCGANDENVYYGGSAVFAPDGKVLAEAEVFQESLIHIDTSKARGHILEERDDTADLIAALTLGIGDYFYKQNFSKAVIGLSGGIDSAVVATLAARAIGGENILGVLMPSEYTSQESIAEAKELASNLNMPSRIVSIKPFFDTFVKELKPSTSGKDISLTLQNLQSRSRGMVLMAISNEENRLVFCNSNKSEIAMGYSTLYGDTVGAIAPIADLLKSEVYEIARYLNKHKNIIPDSSIRRAPSAELRPGQKDEDELPPYDKLDSIISLYLDEGKNAAELIGMGFAPEMVDKALQRIENNEYKRRQLPMGIKISKNTFFLDRKMPLVRKSL